METSVLLVAGTKWTFRPKVQQKPALILLIFKSCVQLQSQEYNSKQEYMNICIDIIKADEERSSQWSGRSQKVSRSNKDGLDFDFAVESPRKQKGKNLKNAWNKAERKKYIAFLKKNMGLFALSIEERKVMKINVMMSDAIKSRTPAKCHSYHQKMMIRYGSIQNIIQQHSTLFQKRSLSESMRDIEEQSSPTEVRSLELEPQIVENCQPEWMRYLELSVDSDTIWPRFDYDSY